MGTCGSEEPAFNGSRVMLSQQASKRALSSLRMQAKDHESTVRWEGSQLEKETDYRMLPAAFLEHVHFC